MLFDLDFLSLLMLPLTFSLRVARVIFFFFAVYAYTRVCVCVCVCARVRAAFSHVRFFATPGTVAHQALLSMEFSRQEYWGIAISFFRGSSQPRDETCIFCISFIGRCILYHLSQLGSHIYILL